MKKRTTRKTKKTLPTGKSLKCQCTSSCSKCAESNSVFCKKHKNMCNRRSPLSGSEPNYNPSIWNNNYKLRETHNCFAYAFNINDDNQMNKCKDKDCNVPFIQPGASSGYSRFSSRKMKTCPNMVARVLGDNPSVKMATFSEKCPIGTSKIALIADADEDYHFLRQDSNGYWSHKPGARKVTNRDASEKFIYDPALADYNYKKSKGSHLDYDNFCSYMCVPRSGKVYANTSS